MLRRTNGSADNILQHFKDRHIMGLLNPVYAFFIPFFFGITIPLAVLAGITTTFAFSILICRVIVVYLDFVLSIIARSLVGLRRGKKNAAYFMRPSTPSPPIFHSHHGHHGHSYSISPSASTAFLRRHHRHRRSSAETVAPVTEAGLGLIPSVGPERDFEGIGGWRSGGDDDEIWTTINSRLELPDRQHSRSHHRSLSGGPAAAATNTSGDGGFLMMKGRTRSPDRGPDRGGPDRGKHSPTSPNSSRLRAPSSVPTTTAASTTTAYASTTCAMNPANKGTKRTSSGV